MTGIIIAIVLIALIALGAFAWWSSSRKKQTEHLQEKFGPEYDRALASSNKKSEAEKELTEREKRVENLHIKELEPGDRQSFASEWQVVQAKFVDSPVQAIKDADNLVQKVMDRRGYPVDDFEQMAADLSVQHGAVVRNYRAAHTIAEEAKDDRANTEDLRQAMIHYRALFSDLLGETVGARS
jgi:FtsZ-interacting cell division protein ZipA